MEILGKNILIIGGGAAGLNAALNLESKDILLIELPSSNSLLSLWNLMIKEKEILKKEILERGNKMNDLSLVEVFLNHIEETVQDLRRLGIEFRKSNIGLIPNYFLPGKVVREIFLKKIKKKIEILEGKVENFLIDERKKIRGVEIKLLNSQRIRVFFNYLIIAAGGLGGFFKFNTGSPYCDGSILSLCYEAGLAIRNIEFFMFHPFLITDQRLPRVLISGEILTKMEYENEKGIPFLSKEVAEALRTNRHHGIFPQMIKEFYLESLKGKIFGRLICQDNWFEKFKRENEFGYIFKNFKRSEIERIEIHPTFHYTIGGLLINKKAQTSQENIYAAGEITGGLHGANRIGGLAVLEALIFGKIAAQEINKRAKEKKVIIPKNIKIIGNLGLSKEMKEKIWQVLGPIKNKRKLEDFKNFLENKEQLTSEEKLLKKIIEISLLRKESVGAFQRDDLPYRNFAKSSYLVNQNIIFK